MSTKTRKYAPLTDSEHSELKKMARKYGLSKSFYERAGITRPTFNALVKNGGALEETVAKVRAALAPSKATKEAVILAVCSELPATPEQLRQDGHEGRMITAYLLDDEDVMPSLSSIARELGYKDHTAVIANNKKVVGRMDVDTDFRKKVERCRRAIIRKPSND